MTYNNLISQIVGLFYWQYPLNYLLGHLDFWNGDRYAWKKETGTTISGEYTQASSDTWVCVETPVALRILCQLKVQRYWFLNK